MLKYRINKVTLSRSSGFPSGGPSISGLSEGLNVVWGPNGIGKSSLASAMRSLVWGGAGASDVEACAELESSEGLWDLRLNRGDLQQIRQADNRRMPLPGRTDDLSESYWFPLHELLDSGQKGAAFLNRIQKEMQGGIDLSKAWSDAGGKKQFVNAGHSDVKRVAAALQELKEVRQKQEQSKDIPDRIKACETALEQMKVHKARLELLDSARRIKNAEQEVRQLEGKLKEYPAAVQTVRRDSFERLTTLRRDLAQKEKELADERAQLLVFKRELERCGITDKQMCDETREKNLRNLVRDFEKKQDALSTCEKDFLALEAAEAEWRAQYSWIAPEPPAGLKIEECVSRLSRLAGEYEPLRCAVEANSLTAKALGEIEPDPGAIEDISQLVARLQDWIKAGTALAGLVQGRVVTRELKLKILGLSSVLSLLAAVFAVFVNPAFSFVLLVVPLLLWLLLDGRGYPEKRGMLESALAVARDSSEKLMEKLGRQMPEWSVDNCVDLQRELLGEQQRRQAVLRDNTLRRQAEERLAESSDSLRKWEGKWTSAVRDIGLDADIPLLRSAPFYNFSEQLVVWAELSGDKAAKKALFDLARKDYDNVVKALQDAADMETGDCAALLAAVEVLVENISNARRLFSKIEDQESVVARVQARCGECESAISSFWQSCGVVRDDDAELEKVASQVEAWEGGKVNLSHVKAGLEALVAEHPDAAELAGCATLDKLDEERGEIENKLAVSETLTKEYWTLKSEYDALRDGDRMEKSVLQYEQAIESLEKLRKNEVLALAVNCLFEHIEKEMETQCRPEALEKASEWLERITQGRYTLGAGNDGFFARDTVHCRNQQLDELSSATRVQLLFSVRMAFIEIQESLQSARFPVFFDELLANSDDARAAAIVKAIAEIAKERQVFYFTAQRDEVEKIRHFTGGAFHEIPLAGNELSGAAPEGKYVYGEIVVPEPVENYDDYRELCDAPRAGLWQRIESLHSWHLFTNSELLHAALIKGLVTIGQVVTAMKSDDTIRKRVKLLNMARRYAKAGRCRRLCFGDSALNDPGLKIDRASGYWADTLEYIKQKESVTGNELMDAIENKEIKRYHDDTKKRLRDWLKDCGYLAEGEPLSPEDIIGRLRAQDNGLTPDSDEYKVVARWLGEVC